MASSTYWAIQSTSVEREAERAKLVFLAVAVGLAQLAFVAVDDDRGDGVPALVAVEPDLTVYLTKDANAATLRQLAELAPRFDARHDVPAAERR
jgi:hypothetical protein